MSWVEELVGDKKVLERAESRRNFGRNVRRFHHQSWGWCMGGGWFQNIFDFQPYLGRIPILTNIFQIGWNHQLVSSWCYPPWNEQFAPENQWLEDEIPFGMGLFSGANMLVSGRVTHGFSMVRNWKLLWWWFDRFFLLWNCSPIRVGEKWVWGGYCSRTGWNFKHQLAYDLYVCIYIYIHS